MYKLGMFAALVFILSLACAAETEVPTVTPTPTVALEQTPTPTTVVRPIPIATPAAAVFPTASPTPTETPAPIRAVPVPTRTSALVPAPTATPEPAAEPPATTPNPESPPVFVPLPFDDPEALAAALPVSELACLALFLGSDDPNVIFGVLDARVGEPDPGALDCLGNETIARLMLSSMVSSIGLLSPESVACLVNGYYDIDFREFIEDESVSDVIFWEMVIVPALCLDEDERKYGPAGPDSFLTLEETFYESVSCMADVTGGTRELAEALSSFTGGNPLEFSAVAVVCGLDPNFMYSSNQQPGNTAEDVAAAFAGALDPDEAACILGSGIAAEDFLPLLGLGGEIDEEKAAVIVGCLNDEALVRAFLMSLTGESMEDVNLLVSCVADSIDLEELRQVLAPVSGFRDPGRGLAFGQQALVLYENCARFRG